MKELMFTDTYGSIFDNTLQGIQWEQFTKNTILFIRNAS